MIGPPRIIGLNISTLPHIIDIDEGNSTTIEINKDDVILHPGITVYATGRYIGGVEGRSEYWWMRIRDGVRENISEPTPIHDGQCLIYRL